MGKETDIRQLLGLDAAQSIMDLLEDFELVGFGQYSALIPRRDFDSHSHLRKNILAALLTSKLRLSSIDYTRNRYCSEDDEDDSLHNNEVMRLTQRYISAYMTSKGYISTMLSKVSAVPKEAERFGAFGASVALMRLQDSFFSAHILYQLGHQYEGHAVSRLILEQIAWAYSASQLDDAADSKRLVTTKCVSKLTELNEGYGRLYGILSGKTHIDARNHREFLRIEDGVGVVLLTHSNFAEYAFVMLALADLFGIVWEISQAPHIQNFEATEIKNGVRSIWKDRPFREKINEHLAGFERSGSEFKKSEP